jgi:hypothetical protein
MLRHFHKQHGTYASNPLVIEAGMSAGDAMVIDRFKRQRRWITRWSALARIPIKFMLDTGAIETSAPWNQIATYDFLPK